MNFSLSDVIVIESNFKRTEVFENKKMDMSATVENQFDDEDKSLFKSIFEMRGYANNEELLELKIIFISKVGEYDDDFSGLHINDRCLEVFFKAYEDVIKDYIRTILKVSTLEDITVPTFENSRKKYNINKK